MSGNVVWRRCYQSTQIGWGLATIFGASVLWLTLNEAWVDFKTEADTTITNTTGQQSIDWIAIAWDNYVLIVLGVVILATITAAVFQRQGGL